MANIRRKAHILRKNCKMGARFVTLATVLICCHPALALDKIVSIEPSAVLDTLHHSHPRLMLKDKDLNGLKERYAEDEVLQRYLRDVLDKADIYSQRPMLTYSKIGPRLLHISRECLSRIYTLALAWRWTGEKKYAAKARENLLAVCDFPDWNPSHFLDTAEMSHAVGVGYDWLFHYLDNQTHQQIKSALIEHGMKPGMATDSNKDLWLMRSESNWNQVCNSGLLIAALAIAETDPEYANFIVPRAVATLPKALSVYGPDGVWPEGPHYWHYATRYTTYGLAALNTALGKDFGLSQIMGLSETGFFPIYTTGATGLFLNFADSGEKESRIPLPCLFWLARTYKNPLFVDAEHATLAKYSASAEHVLWYTPPSPNKPYPKDLDHYFRGPVEVVVFRSAWDNPEALFVGVKAGYNQLSHAHLDLGNFELDALGVRWARDLGRDNYNLPGYWDWCKGHGYWRKTRGGRRWSYYRLRSVSHNVPLLARKDQDEFAKAKIIKYQSKQSCAFAIIDLTSAYKQSANKTTRGVAVVQNRRAVLIQDEFDIETPCEVAWGMTTDARISIRKNGIATLTLDGRKLIARVLSPADAKFTVESAQQKPPEMPNTGVRRLLVRLPQTEGSVRIAILLSPVWKDNNIVKTVELKPLAEW